jgi:hypothetical protein
MTTPTKPTTKTTPKPAAKTPRSRWLHIRVTADEHQAVEEYAARQMRTTSDAARLLLRFGVEHQKNKK